MLQSIFNTLLHTVEGYILLMILIRALGRKAISQMTLFDFILAITLGSLAAHVSLAGDNTPAATATALVTFAVLGVITDYIHIKSIKAGKVINSEPIVLINRGKIVKPNLKKARVSLTDLTSMLREKSVFSLSNVNYAIMENNGKVSVLLKSAKAPLTASDMQISLPENGLTRDIILDGRLMRENLIRSEITEGELLQQLKQLGIERFEDAFYAGVDSSGKVYATKGDQAQETEGEYGIE